MYKQLDCYSIERIIFIVISLLSGITTNSNQYVVVNGANLNNNSDFSISSSNIVNNSSATNFTVSRIRHSGGDGGSDVSEITCEQARLKCAFRTGCSNALNNYLEACSQVMQGVVNFCPEHCQYALVALTSTEEGKHLMNCECSEDFCENTKRRIEICRAQVLRTIRNETVSCRVAHGICTADAQCSTALDYYNRLCKSMFHGKKCTYRCFNSISILQKQEKAAKLNTCQCDGYDPHNCREIQDNMARLCFHKQPTYHNTNRGGGDTESNNNESNEIHPSLGPMMADSSASIIINSLIMILCLELIQFYLTVT